MRHVNHTETYVVLELVVLYVSLSQTVSRVNIQIDTRNRSFSRSRLSLARACVVTCPRACRGVAGRTARRVERETTHSASDTPARRAQQSKNIPLCTDDFGSLSRKMRLPAKCSPVNVNSQAALRTIN